MDFVQLITVKYFPDLSDTAALIVKDKKFTDLKEKHNDIANEEFISDLFAFVYTNACVKLAGCDNTNNFIPDIFLTLQVIMHGAFKAKPKGRDWPTTFGAAFRGNVSSHLKGPALTLAPLLFVETVYPTRSGYLDRIRSVYKDRMTVSNVSSVQFSFIFKSDWGPNRT